jgi:hypothetical protein
MPSIDIAGHEVLFDEEDAHLFHDARWVIRASSTNNYVQRSIYLDGEYQGYESVHRIISGCPPGMVVDHVNGNGLDNRRFNLRVCTHTQNMQNRKIHRNNQSGFKGVYFDPQVQGLPWRAQITANGKKHYLGRFSSPISAHQAYLKAAERFHGEFARTA